MLLDTMYHGSKESDALSPENLTYSERLREFDHEMVYLRTKDILTVIDFLSAGRVVEFVHEDNVANFNAITLDGFDLAKQLLGLQSYGLVHVFARRSIHMPTGKQQSKRFFVVIGELTPLGYDFVQSCHPPD